MFQSTPSQRGRSTRKYRKKPVVIVSIHALAKRATVDEDVMAAIKDSFNPRPRKEGDVISITALCCLRVSIHALAKRATPLSNISAIAIAVSIHALAKRATAVFKKGKLNFGVSIHALAKRATGRKSNKGER